MVLNDVVHVFIINSSAGGKQFSSGIRKKLAEKKDFEYYVFNTRTDYNAQDIIREVERIFKGKKLRIYACGGSGNFCNSLNGIEDFENIELGFYAKGLTNDFLKCFSPKDRRKFEDLDALIEGESIKIDYIQSDNNRCVNTFSVGLDSYFTQQMDRFRITGVFGKIVPYLLSLLFSIFGSTAYPYEIKVEGQTMRDRYSEVFFGNGGTIGGTLCFEKKPDFKDGKGFYYLIKKMNLFEQMLGLINLSLKNEKGLEYKSSFGYADKITVKRRDGIAFQMDFDGELMPPQIEWNAHIVKEGLNFIIPKGVSLDE